jgi:hypothetical protein
VTSARGSRAARLHSAALALLLLALASVPCPGPAFDAVAGAGAEPLAASAHAGADTAAPTSPPAQAELRPECPCGCDHGPATASASTRLPAALLSAPPSSPGPATALRPVLAEPLPITVHARAIDHVPIGSSRLHPLQHS